MDSIFYEKLKPFILLPDAIEKKASTYVAFEKMKLAAFDLNTADTTQLKSVYGIGSKLAARIIKYREKLGGFVYINQLYEVYGLDSAVVQKLMSTSFISDVYEPAKININIADEQQLSNHPYLNKKIARAIVAYRFQHGNFVTIDDLRNVRLVEPVTFEKIKVYLSIENQPSSGN
jgi:competence ComEA-like helix-hairpin-helix protein